jgi:arsenate reductase
VKAKKWLTNHDVQFEEVHIVNQAPSKEVLAELYKKSGLELKKFFNTSGMKYRELGLKDKVATASENELLVKRPIVTDGNKVTVGFNEKQFEEVWG